MIPNKLICFNCKNFDQIVGGCLAFPDDIPNEIISGENDHSKPLPDQKNNVIYEPIKD